MSAHPGWIAGIAEDGPAGESFRAYIETTTPPYRRVFIGYPCKTREGANAEAERFLSTAGGDDFFELEVWIRRHDS